MPAAEAAEVLQPLGDLGGSIQGHHRRGVARQRRRRRDRVAARRHERGKPRRGFVGCAPLRVRWRRRRGAGRAQRAAAAALDAPPPEIRLRCKAPDANRWRRRRRRLQVMTSLDEVWEIRALATRELTRRGRGSWSPCCWRNCRRQPGHACKGSSTSSARAVIRARSRSWWRVSAKRLRARTTVRAGDRAKRERSSGRGVV